jgi:hypothetical protein
MVMLVRMKIDGFNPNLSSHAKMNPEPNVTGEFEKHPFTERARIQKFFAD